MSTDPIQLVQGIYQDAGLATASGTASAASTASTSTDSSTTTASTATSSSQDYSISPTLQAIMDRGAALGLSGGSLAGYNAQNLASQVQSTLVSSLPGSDSDEATLLGQVSAYQQYASVARALQAASGTSTSSTTTTADPLDSVLSSARSNGTNSATLSSQAQAILKDGTSAKSDAGLAATDANLAQIVGISRTIQGS